MSKKEYYYDTSRIKLVNYVAGVLLIIAGITLMLIDVYFTLKIGFVGLIRVRNSFAGQYHLVFTSGLALFSAGIPFLKYNMKLSHDDKNLRKRYSGKVSYIGIKRYPFRKYHRIDILDESGRDKLFITEKAINIEYGQEVYILHGEKSKFVYKLTEGINEYQSAPSGNF